MTGVGAQKMFIKNVFELIIFNCILRMLTKIQHILGLDIYLKKKII